jgi:hypothetical protein
MICCKICLEPYDHSIRKPYSLSSCPHTFCINCLERLKENKCPVCNRNIISKNINLELLELIPESEYDKSKAEAFKSLNELNELRDNLKLKQDLKLKEHLSQLNLIKNTLNNEINNYINILILNQTQLNNEIYLLENDIFNNLAPSKFEDDIQIKLINSKEELDKNLFTKFQINELKNEINASKSRLNMLVFQVENFKENYELKMNNEMNLKEGFIAEIKTNKKVLFFRFS